MQDFKQMQMTTDLFLSKPLLGLTGDSVLITIEGIKNVGKSVLLTQMLIAVAFDDLKCFDCYHRHATNLDDGSEKVFQFAFIQLVYAKVHGNTTRFHVVRKLCRNCKTKRRQENYDL